MADSPISVRERIQEILCVCSVLGLPYGYEIYDWETLKGPHTDVFSLSSPPHTSYPISKQSFVSGFLSPISISAHLFVSLCVLAATSTVVSLARPPPAGPHLVLFSSLSDGIFSFLSFIAHQPFPFLLPDATETRDGSRDDRDGGGSTTGAATSG